MQAIDIIAGTSIDQVAELLVARTPSRAEFNGIPIRARYATTRPADIVSQYMKRVELRRLTWLTSPEGRRLTAERAATVLRRRKELAEALSDLESLRLDGELSLQELDAVLRWAERIVVPANDVDVKSSFEKAQVVSRFQAAGWLPGAFCGPLFDGADPRAFAGWIVGQWLDSGYPDVGRFATQWRERFLSAQP